MRIKHYLLYVTVSVGIMFLLSSCELAEEEPVIVNPPPVTNDTLFGTNVLGGYQAELGVTVLQGNDGGYLLSGYTVSFGAGDNDIYLTKIDELGRIQWSYTYGGSGNDICTQVIKSNDGNGYVITGTTTSFGASGFDMFAVKITNIGNEVWSWFYKWDGDQTNTSITASTPDGYVLSATSSGVPTANDLNILVVSILESGTLADHKFYGEQFNDYANRIIKTSDNGYIVTGVTYSFGILGDAYFMKLKPDLNIEWTSIYGADGYDVFNDVITVGVDLVATGSTTSYGLTSTDFWLVKTDPNGFVYLGYPRTAGSDAMQQDAGYNIVSSGNGTFTIGGYSTNAAGVPQFMLLNYFADGTLNWYRGYGGVYDDRINSVVNTTAGGYLALGTTTTYNFGVKDLIVMNLRTDGTSCTASSYLGLLGGTPANTTARVTMQNYDWLLHETVIATLVIGAAGTIKNKQCGYVN